MTTHALATAVTFAVALLCPALAHAESGFARPPGYSAPPDDEYPPRVEAPPPSYDFEPQESDLRLSTGPVLRATSERADGGFGAALDIVGQRAVGVRLAGSWVGVGTQRGLSQYDGQLWLDFGAGQRLHPILAAGAGLARLESLDAQGATRTSTLGVGTLRGTLEYVLPIHEADARAGLDLEGALPAIRAQNAPDVNGWVLITARVGIGF